MKQGVRLVVNESNVELDQTHRTLMTDFQVNQCQRALRQESSCHSWASACEGRRAGDGATSTFVACCAVVGSDASPLPKAALPARFGHLHPHQHIRRWLPQRGGYLLQRSRGHVSPNLKMVCCQVLTLFQGVQKRFALGPTNAPSPKQRRVTEASELSAHCPPHSDNLTESRSP